MNAKLKRLTLNLLLVHWIMMLKLSHKLVKEAGQRDQNQHAMVIGKKVGAALISNIRISNIMISGVGKLLTSLDMSQNRCVIWQG